MRLQEMVLLNSIKRNVKVLEDWLFIAQMVRALVAKAWGHGSIPWRQLRFFHIFLLLFRPLQNPFSYFVWRVLKNEDD